MKKLLVPTDLSPIAELGLKLAVEIAKRSDAVISLVNFTRHPLGESFSATGDINMKVDDEANLYTVQLLHATKQKMEELATRYSIGNVMIASSIVDDDFKSGIDEYLKTEEIDLIVMGTSGEENVTEVFTGNHTEQAIMVSSCPVISVRDGFRIEQFSNIVAAVDIIPGNESARGLETLRLLAKYFDSHIHLVHVHDTSSDNEVMQTEYFNQMAKIANLENYSVTILEGNDPAERIIDFARQVSAGLVTVLKNSGNGFRLFSNHFSDRVVKEVGRPVFTVNLHNT
ncbi:universal stress protein [Ohtaekwangia koreensis]|uniref:Nucleotide-binding universal stress protein, UspA family n=1 Tax=Ohtaekwangia koreensis TaxID=688867 RepID=A0A1T5MG74_9BACT|nr:universal stress protein [Ohtaekwangia koreensis]SKC87230.1 Nucleotide-binding universal stress protein, UspA family [Ohtaekwangia koreensis]